MRFFQRFDFLSLRSSKVYDPVRLESGTQISYFLDRKLVLFERLVIVDVEGELPENWISQFVEIVEKRHPGCDFIAKPQANIVIDRGLCADHRLKVVPWGTYRKDIALNDSDLLHSFKGNARRDAQKAFDNGVQIKPVSAYVCHQLLTDMFVRQGQPAYVPSLGLLKGFENELSDNVLMLGAFDQGEVHSIVAVPFDEEKGYYLYGASVPKPTRGAMHLLQYEVMRQLRDRGVREYDFFGARLNLEKNSKIAGIQRFKESFKPRLVEGYSFKVILRPWKYRLFELAVAVYYRLKGARYEGDAIDQILKEQRGG